MGAALRIWGRYLFTSIFSKHVILSADQISQEMWIFFSNVYKPIQIF